MGNSIKYNKTRDLAYYQKLIAGLGDNVLLSYNFPQYNSKNAGWNQGTHVTLTYHRSLLNDDLDVFLVVGVTKKMMTKIKTPEFSDDYFMFDKDYPRPASGSTDGISNWPVITFEVWHNKTDTPLHIENLERKERAN